MVGPQGATYGCSLQETGRRLQNGQMKPQQRSLVNWTSQKWRTSSGKPSLKTGERYLPSAAFKGLSRAEIAATNAAKRKGMKAGKQFVKQPKSIARKTAAYR
jgi:hypothetical protein